MADSLLLFDVFGEQTRKTGRNILRQPMSSENIGKTPGKVVLDGPVKPNQAKKPVKPGEAKKSFLSNVGQVLQTPVRQVFSPRAVKASPLIYTEENDEGIFLEDMEFTKPSHRYDIYYSPFDDLVKAVQHDEIPSTPPPKIGRHTMEILSDSFNDDHDYSLDSLADDDLGLPDIY